MAIEIQGKTVVLTGALSGMTRKEATKKLEAIGANVLSSVTKDTDLLFYGDKAGSKLSKAERYGIPVYPESDLLELLEITPEVVVEVEDDGEDVEVLQEIEDGEVVEVQGSAAAPYEVKNVGGVYSCSCPAWRNQSNAIDKRTCKHLMAIRGQAAEAKRVGGTHNVRKSAKTESDKPQLLLAQKWEEHVDPAGWWMSEKLDGVRAYWDGTTFWSRLGNEFLAPDWFTADLPSFPLDGELWMRRGEFQKTVGVVKRQDRGTAWEDIKYLVFDAPDHEGTFEERLEHVMQHLAPGVRKYAEALEHAICDGFDHLYEELERIEGLGGEGLMLRQKGSNYVKDRSSTLLKVKTFHDAEAKVIGYTDGAGRHRGRIGALMLARPDGVTFKCGTGLSDNDRENPPNIGMVVTYRYQELTKAGVPRFPSYIGPRADAEWPEDAVEVAPKTEAWPSSEPESKPKSKSKGRTASARTKDVSKLANPNRSARQSALADGDAGVEDDEESGSVTRRCEYVDDASNKFWEVTVSGNSLTACWGRIGTNGQTKEKTFASHKEAQADADKQFKKKVSKGYVEV